MDANRNLRETFALSRDSLVTRAAEALREGIASGLWREFLPGERDLSARLCVSRPTLRAALDLLHRDGVISVKQGMRRRIKHAPPTKPVASRTIGFISPAPLTQAPPFVMLWVDQLRTRLAEAGYHLEVLVSRSVYRKQPAAALTALAHREPVAAWVIYLSQEPMQRWFVKRKLPVVVAGSCWPGVALPSVDVDYRAACRHAAGHLLGHGHRRIVLLRTKIKHAGDVESELGLREAVAARKGSGGLVAVVKHDETIESIARHVDSVMSKGPAAFVVARSAYALTVITHLLRRGYRMPDDVAVVSRDDDGFLRHVTPAVSRYVHRPAQFGRHLSRIVLSMARNGAVPVNAVRLMPRFMPGETA